MIVTLNGETRELPGPCSVAELVAQLGLGERRVAVEVNRQLVRRAEHAGHALAAGDAIEVVTLVGGG